MESNKLLEAIKNKRIEELEKQLSNQYNTENEKEKEIEALEQEIIELKKELSEIKETIKKNNKEYGSDNKINDDIRQLNIILEHLSKTKRKTPVVTYLESLEKVKQDNIEKKNELIESNNNIKKQVEEVVKKINENFDFIGTRKSKMGIDIGSLKNLLINRKYINKNNEYNYELIQEYYENLEAIEKKETGIYFLEENKRWIESNLQYLPEKLAIENVKRLLEEKKEVIIFYETANSRLKVINAEINKKNKEIKKITNQIKTNKSNNSNKKQSIESEIEAIQMAKTLKDVNLTIQEAREELNDKTRDYIVIPVEKGIEDIFNYKKKVNMQIDSNNLENTYNAETISGTLNSNYTITDEEIAILIPLDNIKSENIVRIEKEGKIVLKKFDLSEDTKIIAKKGSTNSFKTNFDTIYDGNETNLREQIKELLGENFTENKEEYKNYKEFDDKDKNVITPDDIRKISAILESINANYFKMKDRKLIVDGEYFGLEDKINSIMRDARYKEILIEELDNRGFSAGEKVIKDFSDLRKNSSEDNHTSIDDICVRIDEFINDPKNNIDNIYKDLLKIYMTENERAKAFYNDDKYTQVEINGKKISIKPRLPQNDDEIYKTLFRKSEDKIYKVMKTAALCNKIAHLYQYRIKKRLLSENRNKSSKGKNITALKDKANKDSKEIGILRHNKNSLLNQKTNLIQAVIDMSKDNENISLGKVVDERGDGIAMDIPGYTTIVLHLPSRKSEITNELAPYRYVYGERKEYSKEDKVNGVISSGIINYGVNKQLIEELRGIKRRERLGFLNSLDLRRLQNILVSLGYTSEDFRSKKGKKKIMEEISSDERLDKILGNDELCR